MKSTMRVIPILVFAFWGLSFLFTASPGFAQASGTGTIVGTVRDQSGAVVPGATVKVRDVAKNLVSATLSTNTDGRYVAPFLVPSQYEITAEKSGFAKVVRAGITLGVGDVAEIDITLKVSATTEVITVTEAAPLLDTSKTESTQTVGQVMVENLPINGRRWENFVLLTPGVTTDGGFGLVSYRGISGLYNNNQVDGANNNQAFFSESRGRTRAAYTYSQDVIREFQVKNSNFDAEYGQAAGGVVNAVTKSGTNDWHGTAFYFLRHFKMNALDSVSKASGATTKPEKLRHQFGGSFGGPLLKDKLFLFGSYDGQRRSFPVTVLTSNPNFFTSSASKCPAQASAAQCAAATGFLKAQLGAFPRRGDQDVFFGKLDYVVNDNNRVSAALNWQNWRAPNGILTSPTLTRSITANGSDNVQDRFVIVNLNSAIRSNLANEFRFQFGKDFEFQSPNFPGPNVFITGAFDYGMPNFLPRAAFPNERRWQFTDNLSIVSGNHTIRTGFDFNAIHEVLENLFQGGGVYSYTGSSAFPNWVLDVFGIDIGDKKTGKHYTSLTQAFDPITGTGKDDFWDKDYAAYFQDNWRVRPNLQLNLGLRWELQTIPQPPKPNTATPLLALNTSTINIDKNNFGPRFGLSWQPFKKTVIRTGYGLFYAKTSNSTFFATRVENGVFQQTFSCRPTDSCAPLFPNLIFTPTGPTPVAPFSGALTPQVVNTNPPLGAQVVRGQTPDFVNPLVHMGEFVIERELPAQFTVTASYLFSRGQRLPVFVDANLAPATATKTYDVTDSTGLTVQQITVPFYTKRLDPAAGVILTGSSTLNSWYHGFVLSVRKRYTHGFELLANLTISKAIDNGQVIGTNGTFNGTNTPLDPLNLRQESALSDLDQRKRFVGSFVWDPPFDRIKNTLARGAFKGFKFSGILTFADGRPETGFITRFFPSGAPNGGVTGGEVDGNGIGSGGRLPQVGRNVFTNPGLATVDFRVGRDIRIRERFTVRVLWEAFNIFNRTNFTSVNTTAANFTAKSTSATSLCSSKAPLSHLNDCLVPRDDFLIPRASGNTLIGARQMQVSMRVIF